MDIVGSRRATIPCTSTGPEPDRIGPPPVEVPVVYALVFGFLLPMVVKMNEVLGRSIGSVPASASVHATGAVFVGLCVLPFIGREWVVGLGEAPWWSFLGGVIGSLLVVIANQAVTAVGVAAFTAVSVAAQLVISAGMDHFGLFGSDPHLLSPARAAGIALLTLGALLVVRG
jgi:transporter family-2 protein